MLKKLLLFGIFTFVIGIVIFGVFQFSKFVQSDPHTHQLVYVEEVLPTCESDGCFEYWYCSACGDQFFDSQGSQEVMDSSYLVWKAQHTLVYVEEVPATCHSQGVLAHYICVDCNRFFSNASGSKEVSSSQLVIPMLEHKLIYHKEQLSTCCIEGHCQYWQCEYCEQIFLDSEGQNAIESIEQILLPTLPHQLEYVPFEQSTCLVQGNIEHYYCKECKQYFADSNGTTVLTKEQVLLPLAPHSDCSDWVFDDNYHYRYCSDCNSHYESEKHTYVGGKCTECGYIHSGQYIRYELDILTNTYTVTGLKHEVNEVYIPYMYKGKYVTAIADNAFANTDIREVILSVGIRYIGNNAFYSCNNLENIVLPYNLNIINQQAFAMCNNIRDISIPSTVSYIDNRAFMGCNSIQSIAVDENKYYFGDNYIAERESNTLVLGCINTDLHSLDNITSIGKYAFYNCKIKQANLPSSITKVGDYAFYGCTDLTQVSISNVTDIGSYAFGYCTALQNIELRNVVTIADNAFMYNTSLEYIILGISIDAINDFAFANCTALSNIYYYGNATQWSSLALGYKAIPTSSRVFYYSKNMPTAQGLYWHIVNGLPQRW